MGVSKVVKNAMAAQNTRVGTPLYLSPELIKQKPYDYKIDVWAMGCILYQMCTGKAPFAGENLISLGYSIVHNQPPPISNAYSSELSELVMKLLEKNPTKRPSAAEAFMLISQYRRQARGPISPTLKASVSKSLVNDSLEKKQIIAYGNGFHGLIDKDNLAASEVVLIDTNDRKAKDFSRQNSPRRGKLSKILGKVDSHNSGVMANQLKRDSLNNNFSDKDVDHGFRLQGSNSQSAHILNAKRIHTDSAEHIPKAVELINAKEKPNLEIQYNFENLKNKPVSQENELQKESGRQSKASQRGEKAAQDKLQVSSFEAKQTRPVIAPNSNSNYIRPIRNIQSAYGGGENRQSSNKLVVNSKKMPDKIKCIELMLQRAILNDPIHNMLICQKQPNDPFSNPYSPPVPAAKTLTGGFDKGNSKEYKELVTEPKHDKITLGSMPTGGLELIEKGKTYQNEGITQDASNTSSNMMCHPFIDPFKKQTPSSSAFKSEIRFPNKETAIIPETLENPKREVYRAKVRPQTASANFNTRPGSSHSGLSGAGGASGSLAKDKHVESNQSLADQRIYRIKTAVGSAKKEAPNQNQGYSRQSLQYTEKKVTIHDL